MFRSSVLSFAALLAISPAGAAEDGPSPLVRAHAHNDYLHERPLLDALDSGFCSVEADIFLVDGELRVGHDRWQLRKGRTLEALYLKPLADRVRAHEGRVYPAKERFLLLIDIKADGEKVYPVLDRLLSGYPDVFTSWSGKEEHPKAVTAILSGDRPRALVEADPTRFCALDGRPPDLDTKASPALIPLVSDRWGNHFEWRGRGAIPPEELAKLKAIVQRTHDQQRLLRFWAVPDRVEAWKVLHDCGVDLINTDRLEDLADFLRTEAKEDERD